VPVRLGFPIGVKGIVQLVQGPQYATGVGLVRYGATQLWEAHLRQPGDGSTVERPSGMAEKPSEQVKHSLWGWLKAAF
jgi:cell division protein FtsA